MYYYAYCLYENLIKGAHIVLTQLSHRGYLTIIKMSILGSSGAKSVISYSRGRFTWHIILMTFIARLGIYMAVKNAVPDLYLLQGSKCTCSEYTCLFCVSHCTCLLYFDSILKTFCYSDNELYPARVDI
jgi:hypothetical protein